MLDEPMWMKQQKCMHSTEPWILPFTTNYSSYHQCQLHWPDWWRKLENSIRIGTPSLVLLEDSNVEIHAFGKSWKKDLRSMPSHNPLLSDRTEDEDMDVAMVTEDSLRKNASAVSTIISVSIAV